MTNIVHFHYNTAQNVNIGDEAHVLAIQDTLRQRIKDVNFINLPISFLCRYQLPATLPLNHALPLFVHNAARRLRGVSYEELIRTVNDADLVIIGGGGVYMDHLLPFNSQLIEAITTPVVVFGAGYNRNFGSAEFDERQIASIQALGAKAKLQSVRDANTLSFLQRHGVTAELVGDPAVFLQKADADHRPKPPGITIGINIAAHGWKQQAQFEATLIDAYVALVRALRGRATFRYFVHHPGEHRIVEALEDKGAHFDMVIDADARTTKAAYAQIDCTISMMLHSTILAFGEGKPSLCIGYDDKNKSFMDLTDQAGRYVRVDELTPTLLIQKVENLIDNLADEAARAQQQLHEARAWHNDFSDRVAALIS